MQEVQQSSAKRRSLISALEVLVFDLSRQRLNLFPSVLYTTPLSELWKLGEQWCGFDESHTDVCIKGHVSQESLQAGCIQVFPLVSKKQGEYFSFSSTLAKVMPISYLVFRRQFNFFIMSSVSTFV